MTVRASALVALAWLTLGAAAPLGAQATLRGVVRDRVGRDAPLSGAEVFVLGTPLTTITNDSGRFELTLPPGRHSIVAAHPMLDTLGLSELEIDIEVNASGAPEIELSTPTLGEFQADRCGYILVEGQGILLGTVVNSDGVPASGASVRASWGVRRITYRSSELGADTVRATADSTGAFILCGLPRGESAAVERMGVASVRGRVTLELVSGESGAGPLLLEMLDGAVTRRDLVVGTRVPSATVTGRLVTAEGEPVARAAIASRTDSGVTAMTDSLGRFRLRVARRTDQLLMRAIGRMPLQVELALIDAEHDLGDLQMPEAAQQLEAVTVNAVASAERQAFDERRRVGSGTFLDDEELKRAPVITLALVASRAPQTEVFQVAPGDRRFMMSKPGRGSIDYCSPRFFIDGQDLGTLSGPEQEFFFSQAVRLEIYRATVAPPRYNDFDGCGVVLVWTR